MARMELLGRGIQHSASPGMWRRILGALGDRSTYGLRDVPESGLGRAVADLRAGIVDRFDVTMPYKPWAFSVAETCGEDVRVTGIANGLELRDGLVLGVNTDVAAARSLLAGLPRPVGTALVLGAGSTGRSLVRAVGEVADRVLVTNRSPARAEELTRRPWAGVVDELPWEERERAAADASLVVNTTSCGLTTPESPLRNWTSGGAAVLYDLVYAPAPTALQRQAAAAGAVMVDGLAHLLAHARATLARAGTPPLPDAELRAIMTEVGGRAPLEWERP